MSKAFKESGAVIIIALAIMITLILLAIIVQNGDTNEKAMRYKCIEKTMNKDACIIK